jgi:ABC-type multidrug transport system ATPase subunit
VIKTRGLTKQYGNMLAVDHIDLKIEPGEIYGFLGPNGAGKTSTIMMLLGLSKPTSGEIYLFGKNILMDPLRTDKESAWFLKNIHRECGGG